MDKEMITRALLRDWLQSGAASTLAACNDVLQAS